jgi:hypothetical protein
MKDKTEFIEIEQEVEISVKTDRYKVKDMYGEEPDCGKSNTHEEMESSIEGTGGCSVDFWLSTSFCLRGR